MEIRSPTTCLVGVTMENDFNPQSLKTSTALLPTFFQMWLNFFACVHQGMRHLRGDAHLSINKENLCPTS